MVRVIHGIKLLPKNVYPVGEPFMVETCYLPLIQPNVNDGKIFSSIARKTAKKRGLSADILLVGEMKSYGDWYMAHYSIQAYNFRKSK